MSPGSPLRLLLISGVLLVAGTSISVGSLRADVIYTNFGEGDSYAAGAGLIVTNDGLAWSSVAVAFTPAANYTLSSIEFVAAGLNPDGSDFATLAIFADNAGQPDAMPLETLTSGMLGQFGITVPVITLTSAFQPLLLAGTQYWIGMNAPAGDFIVWNQNNTLAEGYSQSDGAGNWSVSDTDQGVIEIDGLPVALVATGESSVSSVPEPGSWWLVAAGISVLAFRRGTCFRSSSSTRTE